MNNLLKTPGFPDDALAQASEMIGQDFRIEQWNYEATRDTIRHYAWGLGDDNPLYCDPSYAENSYWGTVIAPPTFLYSIFDAVVAPGLADIQWIYSGTDWTFDEPVKRNDEIVASAKLAGAKELSGGTVKRMILQTGDVAYHNQHGRRVGRALSHCFRVPRATADGGLSYKGRAAETYSAEDLEKIKKSVLQEYRRGREDLFWEDVDEDMPLPETVRGPLSLLDMTCYYAGAVGTSGYKSTKLKWLYAHWANTAPELLPNNYDKSYYAAAVSPSIGHQDKKIAVSEIGMPGPYDNGPQRIGMLCTPVTNWIGDSGFVRNLSVRIKAPVIFGDTSTFGGAVTGKRLTDDGRGLVDFSLYAKNQLGDVTATGTATAEIPRR